MFKGSEEQLRLCELRDCYDSALLMIERQRSQLSLALFVLADLGFDLNDFMDALS
jgi:hypothetical protein